MRGSVSLHKLMQQINVASRDNGQEFIVRKRFDAIVSLLATSAFQLICNKGLALIYANMAHDRETGILLISNHIDSRYKNHFYRDYSAYELLGTFDNSLCNAIIVQHMQSQAFQPNIMIAFTGDEEKEFRGVDQIMAFFKRENLIKRLEMVITCDTTSAGYSQQSFTVENYFARRKLYNQSILRFKSETAVRHYIRGMLDDVNPFFIRAEDSSADESWEYDEYDLNCFSLCIPCAPYPLLQKKKEEVWMHSDRGILVEKKAIHNYSRSLLNMSNNIAKDIINSRGSKS